MRAVLLLALLALALAAGCGGSSSAGNEPTAPRSTGTAPATALRITVWPRGRIAPAPARRYELRCEPAGGSLPRPAMACAALAARRSALRPVSPDMACTQLYGGPQEALVRGAVRGDPIRARFSRTDGCEIDRWDRLRALFPVRL